MSTSVVVVGYSAGGVRFFHGGNGSLLGSAFADSAVLAVKKSGQVGVFLAQFDSVKAISLLSQGV